MAADASSSTHLEDLPGEEPGRQLLAIRFGGDITTKAQPTRKRFVKRLVANVKDALKTAGVRGRIGRTRNRVYVSVDERFDPAVLARVFGVQAVARVRARSWKSDEDIVREGLALFADKVRGRTFAVRARRVGDRPKIPADSQHVQRELGAALAHHAAGVDLDAPEVAVQIEITRSSVYYFEDEIRGHGGLPLGTEGRAVALVSGGFDSPVSAWQMMKRGVGLDYVFCNLGGRNHQLETLQVMEVIAKQWSYGTHPRFHAVDFEEVTQELQNSVTQRYWQIILKRLMLRAAEAVANERGAVAIITGEAVGQVSSQTLQNLMTISAATSLPILRPVVGFNKEEIIEIARKIGTEPLSSKVQEYCALVPRKPATAAELAVVDAEDARMDPEVLARAVAERSVFDLRSLDLSALERPEIMADDVPDDALVIDLRSKAAYSSWHYPDALFLDFASAMRAYPAMDRGRRYILYCEFGLKSAHLAELMRRAGLDATHFAGGLKALIRYAEERGIETPEI